MDSSDSLHLDEHLARLLAAYDQGIGDGDGKAPTIDLLVYPPADGAVPASPAPAADDPDTGFLANFLPDSRPNDAYTPELHPHAGPDVHRIGRFELRRQLGKGGCGIVFLAYDPKLKREVALKLPRPELLLSTDARRRLIREALAAAEFDHPNLVPVYETGEIGPVCFIATAFCPGQTLADWLERQAFPVPVRQAARLIAQLADAVQHAHNRGVLHRDLKPNNVILQETPVGPDDQGPPPGAVPLRGDYYTPRVVDFGLAKLADGGPNETATRQVLGTPKYMAPEQAQARRDDVGPESDVYALGVILYELLAGRAPYDGATDVEVLRQAIEGQMTPPRHLRTDVPRDLEAICLKAMARTSVKRYRTAIDLADDLRRFLDGRPTLARPLKWVGRTARWLRRNDQSVALVAVSAVAMFFIAVGVWSRNKSQKLEAAAARYTTQANDQTRKDRQWDYARNVRDAFLSWRAGDAGPMRLSLDAARQLAELGDDGRDFAWGYLAQLGRVERLSVACQPAATAVAVAPTRPWVATGHADGTLAVRDRRTGAVLGSVKAHPAAVTHAAFLSGRSQLVTAGGEPGARVWDVDAGGKLTAGPVLPPLGGPVTALTCSADGKVVYVGAATGRCLAWDTAGGRAARTWAATGGEPVIAVAVSADGKVIATVGPTEPVRLLTPGDAEPAEEVLVRGAAGAPALAVNPTGAGGWLLAAAGREDGTVRLFDHQGREVRNLPGHTGAVLALDVSPDGAAVASGGDDDSVCVWDVASGSMRTLLRGHYQPVRGVRFGPDGRSLFTAADDGQLKAWDLTADPEGRARHGLPSGVVDVAVARSGGGFAVAYADGAVELFAHRDAPPRRVPGDRPKTALRFRESGPPVGVELVGRTAYVWEFGPTPQVILHAKVAAGSAVTSADLSPGGGQLALGDDRGRVTVWSLATRTPVDGFDTDLPVPVRHLCFSDDGQQLAALTAGNEVGVWAVGSPRPLYRVQGHGDGTWLIRFAPDGERLVTAGRGSAIKVWTLATGREDQTLRGHVGRVTGLAVSPDGRTLVSGSGTGDVKLWDLRTGQELIGLRRHTGLVTTAEFAADGRTLVTGGTTAGGRGELAFWDAAVE